MNISEVLSRYDIKNVSISHVIESRVDEVWKGKNVTEVVNDLKNILILYVAKYPDTDVHMTLGEFAKQHKTIQKHLDTLS